jgi:tetratricopeptide (TPR) repeat protein
MSVQNRSSRWRKKIMRLGILVLLLGSIPIVAQNKAASPSPEVIYSRCKASVVTILTFDKNRAPVSQGSGFIVAKNRILTNYHVLAGSASASIIFNDGSITVVSTVIAATQPKDLVIVEGETGARPPLVLGDELQLKVGETIYTIGAPNGLAGSLSNGLVSSFRQDEGQFLIQFTAPIAPGSSGGPVLNTQGQVVGVATSKLKDGGFGFAMGTADVQHLLKVPLAVRIDLSDLTPEETGTSTADDLNSIQALLDKKQYEAAHTSFNALSDSVKASFDGQLLLCRIEQERKEYQLSIYACDAAIKARPNVAEPYGLNAYSLLVSGDTGRAEFAASKAIELSSDAYYKNLLALIYYSEQKYTLIPTELSAESNDTFLLTLLAGAALHNRDYTTFRQLDTKLTSLKGGDNGWGLYAAGVAAERDLNWDLALDRFKKCDADKDFIDPICEVSIVSVELRKADLDAAKADIDVALSRYPKDHSVLSQDMFVSLLFGNTVDADRLHGVMKATEPQPGDEFSDCLYYYGRNESSLASSHCQAAIRDNERVYGAWSNAGYVALDNRDFQSALSYFSKAVQLLYDSKDKHTVTEELDVSWGTLIAEYYSGDTKKAKALYRELKKEYPQFCTSSALKQLPLVWSAYTVKLIDIIVADWK